MAMMDVPLNSWLLFENVARHSSDTEVVSQIAPGVSCTGTPTPTSRSGRSS